MLPLPLRCVQVYFLPFGSLFSALLSPGYTPRCSSPLQGQLESLHKVQPLKLQACPQDKVFLLLEAQSLRGEVEKTQQHPTLPIPLLFGVALQLTSQSRTPVQVKGGVSEMAGG